MVCFSHLYLRLLFNMTMFRYCLCSGSFATCTRDSNLYFVSFGIQERSIVITTYALCGFANISSIGIMLGALGAMAPNQRSALAQVVVRAMIAGTVACFMTACIASNYFIIILKKSLWYSDLGTIWKQIIFYSYL